MNEHDFPKDLIGYMAQRSSEVQKKEAETLANFELASKIDKDNPSLGDLNPLIHKVDLGRREVVDSLKIITLAKIEKYNGILPSKIESLIANSLSTKDTALRFVVRFEVDQLTSCQMDLLEDLVKKTYPVDVRTRVGTDGRDILSESYPPINDTETRRSKTAGWYMGPNQSPTDSLHTGLFVFKNLGEVNRNNFFETKNEDLKYVVEIREAGMYQTDLVQFITQVSSILGQEKMLDYGELLYEVYYDLLRLGLKDVTHKSIYGMDEKISQIIRGLILPLSSPEISKSLMQSAESVLLIGVPGTGKTLSVEALLNIETGVFILPVDPLELIKELRKDKDKQTLLPRISEVKRATGREIILHIDDIENMVIYGETHSTLLNLMAGVRESGFYVIASTNEPEKIPPALLQPQRFGNRIYCGLQSRDARYEILKIHALAQSKYLGIPLFESEEERDAVLNMVADKTDFFTPRYLAKIVNVTRSYLVERVAKAKGTTIGLTESDLKGFTFTKDDYRKAFADVSVLYDKEAVRRRDEQLRDFVNKLNSGKIGFNLAKDNRNQTIF